MFIVIIRGRGWFLVRDPESIRKLKAGKKPVYNQETVYKGKTSLKNDSLLTAGAGFTMEKGARHTSRTLSLCVPTKFLSILISSGLVGVLDEYLIESVGKPV